MNPLSSPNPRIVGPLPRRDILAVCAYLNRTTVARSIDADSDPATYLDRLAAAARMQ